MFATALPQSGGNEENTRCLVKVPNNLQSNLTAFVVRLGADYLSRHNGDQLAIVVHKVLNIFVHRYGIWVRSYKVKNLKITNFTN